MKYSALTSLLFVLFVVISYTAIAQPIDYTIRKENLSKRKSEYYDVNRTQILSSGYYYKDALGETTEKHGTWKYYSRLGEIEEERTYYRDMLNGKVMLFYANGKPKQEGYFLLDKPDSIYREWNDLNKLVVEGHYSFGKPSGIWRYYYRDGRLKSEEEVRGGVNYVNSFYLEDSAHTQILKDGNGDLETYFTNGSLKEWYEYENGMKHGVCEEYSPFGYLLLKGSFVEGEMDGPWEYYYYTGDIEKKSHYVKGKLDGPFQYFYDNGQLNVNGRYATGEKTGKWTWYTNSGQRDMEGEFKQGEQHGDWTYWYPSGIISYYAHYNMGLKTGEWTYFYKDGSLFKKGSFVEDKKDGLWETWYEDGTLLMEGKYLAGLEEGEWNNYWENGELKNMSTFKKGLLDGKWFSYYNSGKLHITGFYDEGQKVKEWTKYFENGKTEKVETYKVVKIKSKVDYGIMKDRVREQSELHGPATYYSSKDFKLTEEGSFSNGLKDGDWKAYHPGGRNVAVLSPYKDGKLNGTMKTYDKRGNIISSSDYKNGLKDGDFILYDKRGKVMTSKKFKNGMQVIEGQFGGNGTFTPGR